MTQSFFVATAQTGRPGIKVPVKSVIQDVGQIIQGKLDNVDEEKFQFIGDLTDLKNKI